jgi:hypothetical protein
MCYGGCDCRRCSGEPIAPKKSDRQQCSDDWAEIVKVKSVKESFAKDIEALLPVLQDLYHQATVERSHYYVGSTVKKTVTLLKRILKQQEE